MTGNLECLSCLTRKVVKTAQRATQDPELQQAGVGEALFRLAMAEPQELPGTLAEDLQRLVVQRVHNPDPYGAVRYALNRAALSLQKALRCQIEQDSDPWTAAVRVATAGNALEEALSVEMTGAVVRKAWTLATAGVFAVDDSALLRTALATASKVLFLGDNAGECAWDLLLLERLQVGRLRYTVRKHPYLQDALLSDAKDCGLTSLAQVYEVGFDDKATAATKREGSLAALLDEAELVIAKGSHHLEVLSRLGSGQLGFGLLVPQCERICHRLGVEAGSLVVARL